MVSAVPYCHKYTFTLRYYYKLWSSCNWQTTWIEWNGYMLELQVFMLILLMRLVLIGDDIQWITVVPNGIKAFRILWTFVMTCTRCYSSRINMFSVLMIPVTFVKNSRIMSRQFSPWTSVSKSHILSKKNTIFSPIAPVCKSVDWSGSFLLWISVRFRFFSSVNRWHIRFSILLPTYLILSMTVPTLFFNSFESFTLLVVSS